MKPGNAPVLPLPSLLGPGAGSPGVGACWQARGGVDCSPLRAVPWTRRFILSFRISYCTADKIHDKVFAYIAQNQLNENLECHAFLCTKRKMVSPEEEMGMWL